MRCKLAEVVNRGKMKPEAHVYIMGMLDLLLLSCALKKYGVHVRHCKTATLVCSGIFTAVLIQGRV